MAPPPSNPVQPAQIGQYKEFQQDKRGSRVENGILHLVGDESANPASYPNYLPTWDLNSHQEPLKPYTHVDPGTRADPSFPNLLPKDKAKVTKLTPVIGSDVSGIQLSKLSDAGKDELALFVAQRGVVVFRDQDFADLPIGEAEDFARHFGRLHSHPTSGSPKGHPETHIVYRQGTEAFDQFLESNTTSVAIHSDVSYEQNSIGTTFLYALDIPEEAGGDTAFVSTVEAWKRLSKPFQDRLIGLKATHSGVEQAEAARRKGTHVRRDPVVNAHPVTRQHPATKERSLYVNEQFTRQIVGLKKEESDALLKFLYDHLAKGLDFQVRVKWSPKAVVVFDNRVVCHSALLDWRTGDRRHLARLTPQAEQPTEFLE